MEKISALFFFFLTFLAGRCLAWGPEGHRIVAEIAEVRLTHLAQQRITQLLGNDDLAGISVWADDVRHDRPETFGWHFVDIPKSASSFSDLRDCYRPDEKYRYSLQDHQNCVVDRITMFKQVLANLNAPKQDRIEALKFLVHFVGDIHQPMHAIGEARGGNDVHVIQFGASQCGKYQCNLHFAWDIGLIEHTGLTEAQYVSRLNRLITRWPRSRKFDDTPEAWANESLRLAKKVWLNDSDVVDEKYYKANVAIVDQQLALAGLRLAAMLNEAIGK